MIHDRSDYNRIQDPALENPSLLSEGSTPIAADEPVFLIRAQDKHMVAVLNAYQTILANEGGPGTWLNWSLGRHTFRVLEWQAKNGCKDPDMPSPLNDEKGGMP